MRWIVTCLDPVRQPGVPLDEGAAPATVRVNGKHLLDISARQDGGVERPGVIGRIGVGFGSHKPMQLAASSRWYLAKAGDIRSTRTIVVPDGACARAIDGIRRGTPCIWRRPDRPRRAVTGKSGSPADSDRRRA
jgi:hypothetical protein